MRYIRVEVFLRKWLFFENVIVLSKYSRLFCNNVGKSFDLIMDRVIGLVKKFDKIDAVKVCYLYFLIMIYWL